METIIKELPGYRINEYLLVLNPHEELRNKIHTVQKHFSEEYKTSMSLIGKPNIPLVKFTQYEMMEERILNKLKLIAMAFHPIKVELSDYGSFPTHTIFINVPTKVPIQDLVKQVRSEAQKLMKLNDEFKPHFFTDIHIPIARKLQPWQYEKGWKDYSHKHFTGRFVADGMLLLKREKGTYAYQIVQRLEFENLLIPKTKQGDLFV